MALLRIDRILSEASVASRKEIKGMIRAGRIRVDGRPVADGGEKYDPEQIRIELDGTEVKAAGKVVLMLNKPAGYITAARDPRHVTVMELIPEYYRKLGVQPIGRLDKETEGLLLFTNDGALAHRLMSPKTCTEKEYYARHEGTALPMDVEAFASGMTMRDGTKYKPAVLTPCGEGESRVTVTEGKYHQVRRMLASRGLYVTYLKRIREDFLVLGDLDAGVVRELTETEIARLTVRENDESTENNL